MQKKMMNRRQAMGAMGAAGASLALGCAGESVSSPTTSAGTTTTTTDTNATCAVTPTETAGPYPSLVDLIRSDVREDRTGTQLNLTIKVVNANNGCAPVANADVEIWHCDVAGNYSQYGSSTGRTFLRGIQRSDANGDVNFTTIYPGWYQGRATHIHLEVTINGVSRKVTQIAFPESVNNTVHAAAYTLHAARTRPPTRPTASSPTACPPSSSRRRATPPAGTRRRFRSGSRSRAGTGNGELRRAWFGVLSVRPGTE